MALKVKSIASFASLDSVENTLIELGFTLKDTSTIVSDGKFWHRMLYTRGEEIIFVSEEIGDAYPKDPIVTIYGSEHTIEKVVEVLV
ncbi:MAG: hypothetical protein KatS3mg003_1552 [Candidatus Nitrosocaldaceae archaeon]|nr:MAG: hypothetical protein KatS3mg003_1552 [Candidatus Nitrosocaldaceae archaeon]